MIFLNILKIIGRILFSLCIIGFLLGMFLWYKHPIFADICVGSGFVIFAYGFVQMALFAFLGSCKTES